MSVTSTLRQTDIFYDLTLTQLELVASICTQHSYDVNEVIFEEQTRGSELYVIVDGEVNIEIDGALIDTAKKEGAPATQILATLRRGQSFGEVALIDEGVRSARARAAQADTAVLIIPRDKLMFMCDAYPQMGYRLMRNLAADLAMKIRNTDLTVREYLTWSQPKAE